MVPALDGLARITHIWSMHATITLDDPKSRIERLDDRSFLPGRTLGT